MAGTTVDHEVLLAVADIGDDEANPRLREASAQHLIVPSSAGDRSVYTFRHALLHALRDALLNHHAHSAAEVLSDLGFEDILQEHFNLAHALFLAGLLFLELTAEGVDLRDSA